MTRRPMNGARRNTSDTIEHAARGVGPATDYGADTGEPIYAPFDGVIGAWHSDTGGNTVQVRGNGVTMIAQHLSSYAASIGQAVSEGDLIGYVGSTGSSTDGPHLHWYIERRGERISGETYMSEAGLGYTPYGSRTPDTQPSGGGFTPYAPAIEVEEQKMKFLFITDNVDGNGVPGWALLSVLTGRLVTLRTDAASAQDTANSWARVWGAPQKVARQDMLNAQAAINITK